MLKSQLGFSCTDVNSPPMNHPLLTLTLALAMSSLAFAETGDPPGRVARLSVIRGDVSFQAADAQAPEPAELNRPVTSGDRLLTESGSRAELTMGIAAIRLNEQTDLSIADLDDDRVRLEINSGTISVRLRQLDDGETFEIDMPHTTARLLRPGDYRVDVQPDGSTLLAVRSGEAETDDGNRRVVVRDGEAARIGQYDRFVNIERLGAPDEFDDWSLNRERQLNDAEASRYVSRDVVGYEDLDQYGSWYSEPGYGEVWAPRFVSFGWAPYRFGRWVWVSPWGWTWFDNAPWGFAPFHYGRWAHVHDRWCWVPGPRHRRAVFAPALVAWSARDGRAESPSHDHRPREWIPLAPRELYVPAHPASPHYLHNVNAANTPVTHDRDVETDAHQNFERQPVRQFQPHREEQSPREERSIPHDTPRQPPPTLAPPTRNPDRDASHEAVRPANREQSNRSSPPSRDEPPSRNRRNERPL